MTCANEKRCARETNNPSRACDLLQKGSVTQFCLWIGPATHARNTLCAVNSWCTIHLHPIQQGRRSSAGTYFPCGNSRHQHTSVSTKVVQIIEEHWRLGCPSWSRWWSTWWLNLRNWHLEKFHIGNRIGQGTDFALSYCSSKAKVLELLSLMLFDLMIVTNGFGFQLQRIHFVHLSQYQWIKILRCDWMVLCVVLDALSLSSMTV